MSCCTASAGAAVYLLTVKVTAKLTVAPTTPKALALSSEAELSGVVKEAIEALSLQSLAAYLGVFTPVHVRAVTSAAVSISARAAFAGGEHSIGNWQFRVCPNRVETRGAATG